MEEHILTLLPNISLNDVNIFNGSLFTCKGDNVDVFPCLSCISCKLMMILKFCTSLLNHMSDQEIVAFVHDSVGSVLIEDIFSSLNYLLSPLASKDCIYSRSRARPSLSTDLMDLSLKNYTVSRDHIRRLTTAISKWIASQPHTFKLHFLVSLLSQLKSAVLAEVYRAMELHNKNAVFADRNKCLKMRNGNQITNDVDFSISTKDQIYSECFIDFISMLPVHISKYILNLLDEKSLKICSGVSDNWKIIVAQVRREDIVNQKIKEQSMLLQEVSTKPIDPCYAKDTDVQVPILRPGTHQVVYIDSSKEQSKKKNKRLSLDQIGDENPIPISREVFNIEVGYKNIKTKTVIMEERNVYCGGYSVLLVMEGISKQNPPVTRTISYNLGNLIAVSGSNKIIQFLDVYGRKSNCTKSKIHGHAGTIKVLRIISKPSQSAEKIRAAFSNENLNDCEVLSGSYDTTIRRWDINSGKCLKIYIGHTLTITSLDVGENTFVSGSMDGTCKLWNYENGKNIFTMTHKYSVTAVAMSTKLCVSGDSSGIVKVWDIQNGTFLKNLVSHSKEISAIRVDNFHILSASLDCYVLLWSALGEFNSCIGCFRHPKSVLCMEMSYMRAITGCVDGRIRIWNILTGQCIRIIRGNSKSDPILTMVVNDNRIIINTISNILVLNFETVKWVYNNDEKTKYEKQYTRIQSFIIDRKSGPNKHCQQRYERARFAGNVDPRIFLSPVTLKRNSSMINDNNLFNKGRQFEDGVELTRASAWIITPSFNKSIRLVEEVPFVQVELSNLEDPVEEEKNNNTIENNRGNTNVLSERRISYSFERQTTSGSNIELQEMKNTLRKHIRSRPTTAVEALPDFVKTMISQMKESAFTGRPISAYSSTSRTRRSSGPNEIDLRSKLPIEKIKSALNLVSPEPIEYTLEASNCEKSIKKPIRQPTLKPNISKPLIISSAKKVSNRSVVDNFFVPKEYRKNLVEKKSEFDKRHQIMILQNENIDKNTTNHQKGATVTDLHLKTFEDTQEYLRQVNKIQYDFEENKMFSKECEKYENWLKKTTEMCCPSYEKDMVKKRPRSAKI